MGANIVAFLQRKNVQFSVERYLIQALGAMAQGLFASLIVGLIIRTAGERLDFPVLAQAGQMAMDLMGPAIGVAVAWGLQAPPLVLFASAASGMAGAALEGGPAGAFIAALLGAELGKLVSRETRIDIIVTPAVVILTGYAAASTVGPAVGALMAGLGQFIMWATELHPIPMGAAVAAVMGLALTAPISSAALALMLDLGGLAAGAATVGCAAQMVGFATTSYRANGWGGLLSQGLGTSMLQIPNVVRNPWILAPPTLTGVLLGPLATTIFRMENLPMGAGMGTSGFVGQFGTLEAMGWTSEVLASIGLLHFLAPAILAPLLAWPFFRLGLIRTGDFHLQL